MADSGTAAVGWKVIPWSVGPSMIPIVKRGSIGAEDIRRTVFAAGHPVRAKFHGQDRPRWRPAEGGGRSTYGTVSQPRVVCGDKQPRSGDPGPHVGYAALAGSEA
jgi:hypothetical protein